MKLKLLRIAAALLVGASFSAPAYALVDDGTGCGCIRPCPWIVMDR